MGGVINLIKNLFSGIFSFIGGIFGGKKSGYFMELDETQMAALESVKAKASEAKDAIVENTKSAVAAVESTAKSAVDSVAEGVKDTATATEASAKSATKSVKAKSVKAKAAKAESAKSEPAKPEPVKAETAETHTSANGAKPAVPANALNLPEPTVSFASEYLVPKPTNSRRRPGANMGSFLDMAKTVKTPNN